MDMTNAPPRRVYKAEVYTSRFLFTGEIEPRGKLLDDLNSADRGYIFFHAASISPLSTDCVLGPFSRDEIVVDKSNVIAAYLVEEEARASIGLLKKEERVIIYTATLVLRATVHLGGEMRLRDMFDVIVGTFVPISDVSLFPFYPLRVQIPQHRELLLLNKAQVIFYHPE
ncbi:MAG: hypothetical protein SVX38_11975 [Chloroflexota bacterium]|nr:hypothetical protein [Chloroflexota bacterium]